MTRRTGVDGTGPREPAPRPRRPGSMTIRGAARSTVLVAVVLGLAGCAAPGGTPGSPGASSTAALPDGSGGTLVLRAEHTGGFMAPASSAGRLPIASVYADGRVLVDGPVAAIYPGFAWPNVQV